MAKIYITGSMDKSLIRVASSFLSKIDLIPIFCTTSNLPARISKLIECDYLYLIDGWLDLREACIECYIARTLNKPVFFENKIIPLNNTTLKIESAIYEVTGYMYREYSQKRRDEPLFLCRMHFSYECSSSGLSTSTISGLLNISEQAVCWMLQKYPKEYKFNPSFRANADKISYILTHKT